jgi:hypothetical protein
MKRSTLVTITIVWGMIVLSIFVGAAYVFVHFVSKLW